MPRPGPISSFPPVSHDDRAPSSTVRRTAGNLLAFDDPEALKKLMRASRSELEGAGFGIVGMSHDGVVRLHNHLAAGHPGLDPAWAIGRHYFTRVAPWTNNYLIARRFMLEKEINATMDYVLTLHGRPTRVRLRLLRSAAVDRMYLLIDWNP